VSARTGGTGRSPRRGGARPRPVSRRCTALSRTPAATACTRLVRTHPTIVIEDLNVAGMTRNRRLARHVAGVRMGELRRQVEYKARWSGVRVHIANRWYPSSKTCSGCGAVKTKLRLSERTFRCDECGFVLDRDLNAARNLVALVGEVMGGTSSQSCGATVNEPDGNLHQTHTVWAAGTAREDPRGQRRAARRRLPEQSGHTSAPSSGGFPGDFNADASRWLFGEVSGRLDGR
jgi:putative transposase